jgi:hypothetical protein
MSDAITNLCVDLFIMGALMSIPVVLGISASIFVSIVFDKRNILR